MGSSSQLMSQLLLCLCTEVFKLWLLPLPVSNLHNNVVFSLLTF